MTRCDPPAVPFVHPTLAGRFSPVTFEPDVVLTVHQVDVLLDAARLSPSAGNSQPWSFIVGRRGDSIHSRIVRHLARSSAAWAPAASLLVVNLAHVYVEDTPNWEYSEFARYDLGQAVAHMTIQALTMGLAAHQFRAFDRDALASDFAVPPHWEVTSMTAYGIATQRSGDLSTAGTSRARRTREEVTWARVRAFG